MNSIDDLTPNSPEWIEAQKDAASTIRDMTSVLNEVLGLAYKLRMRVDFETTFIAGVGRPVPLIQLKATVLREV